MTLHGFGREHRFFLPGASGVTLAAIAHEHLLLSVYRALSLLKRHGLVDELDLMHVRGEGHYYEQRPKRDHLHITCLRCAAVVEFESPLFERLQAQVKKECNFHLAVSRLEIGCYCNKCRRM